MKRRQFLLVLSSAAVLLAGCAVPAQHSTRGYTRVETHITTPPPAPMTETIPPAPRAESYWIPGHWKWAGNNYIWANGRWEEPRPNMVYQQAFWSSSNGYWTYHPGRWVSMDAPDNEPAHEIVSLTPPAPQVEVMPAPPGASHIWISGYWRWQHGRYAWAPGYWASPRAGYFWAPGHWRRRGSGWYFSGGYWQRS